METPETYHGASGTVYIEDNQLGIPSKRLIVDGYRSTATPRLASTVLHSDQGLSEFEYHSLDIRGSN